MSWYDTEWHPEAERLNPLIEEAANRIMRRFYKYVDRNDVYQECVMWVLLHPAKVDEYVSEGRDHSILKSLEHAALAYAQKEKSITFGYRTDDIFYWQREEIEGLLPALFSDEARLHPPGVDDGTGGRSNRAPNEGGNWIATLADLGRAYAHLDQPTQKVLRLVYGEDRTRVWVANALGVSDTTIGSWIHKALRDMHRELGGERPWRHNDQVTGSRTAISNSTARAITSSQYDEE